MYSQDEQARLSKWRLSILLRPSHGAPQLCTNVQPIAFSLSWAIRCSSESSMERVCLFCYSSSADRSRTLRPLRPVASDTQRPVCPPGMSFRHTASLSLWALTGMSASNVPQYAASVSQQSFTGSDRQSQDGSSVATSTSLALRRRHVGKNKGSWGQDEYESAELASFHELAAVIGPEEAASDRLAAQRRAQGAGAMIKQALRLGRDNPVRKATTRVRSALRGDSPAPSDPRPCPELSP